MGPLLRSAGRARQGARPGSGGRTSQQIAQELFISVKTAGIHVSNILAKLGVGNRVEAAAAAHRGGLLDDPAP